jgi:hypothetical protein
MIIAAVVLASFVGAVPARAAAPAGTWGAPTEIANTQGGHSGYLKGVSCADAGDCTAVGYDNSNGRPLYLTETAGAWATPTEFATTSGSLTGVSCAAAKDCTAVGSSGGHPSYVTETTGVWGTPTGFATTSGSLTGVSCADAGDCTAVGYDGNDQPLYLTETAGVWGTPTEIAKSPYGGGYLDGVSCADAGDCTAVGYDGDGLPMYVTETAGAWGAPTEIAHTAGGYGFLYGVSCADAGDCAAVGYGGGDPLYVTETAGAWGTPTEIANTPGGAGTLNGVSCADVGDCTAVGYDGEPLYLTETAGAWGTPTEIANTPGGYGGLNWVSCADAGNCTAVGYDGNSQPLYVTETAPLGQSISGFTALPTPVTVGGGGVLSGSASSGLPVSFTVDSSTAGFGAGGQACSVSGVPGSQQVSYDHAGKCVIDADQAGNADYNPAAQVSVSAEVVVQAASPAITSISPVGGLPSGGTSVTITGSGFTGATAVAFGGVAATKVVVSDTKVTAVSPAHAVGTTNVRVTGPAGQSAVVTADQFTYAMGPSVPSVSSVSPSGGTSAGGTTVTVRGSGFTGVTGVAFGGVAASNVVLVSDSQLTAVSPAHGAATTNVRVTTPAGQSAVVTPADQFTYQAVVTPKVSKLTPSSGPVAGGTSVTITGTGFTAGATVSFGSGDPAASVTYVSGTELMAVSPAHAATKSDVNVIVTTAAGTSAVVTADEFTYLAAPTVTKLSVKSGPVAGGTSVTITGTGFTSGATVSFGAGDAATSVTYVSATKLTVVAPPHAATKSYVNVTVTTPGGTSAVVTADHYTYT